MATFDAGNTNLSLLLKRHYEGFNRSNLLKVKVEIEYIPCLFVTTK